MKIITKEIEIKKTNVLTSEYIESALAKMDIEPLRWAIVKIKKGTLTVNVSYCTEYSGLRKTGEDFSPG